MNSTPLRLLSAILIVAIALPAVAQVTEDDLRRAKAEVDRIQSENQDVGDRIQEGWSRQLQLEHEIDSLQTSINHAQIQLAATRERLERVAVEMYMASASGMSMAVLLKAGNDDYQAGMEYLRRVSGSDENLIDQLRGYQNQLDRQTERLAEASVEQDTLLEELMNMSMELQAELASAQGFFDVLTEQRAREEAERIRREEERRREEARLQAEREERERLATSTTSTVATTSTTRAGVTTTTQRATTTTTSQGTTSTTTAPPPPTGDGACPVGGPVSFSDSWGAPRSGGRSHQGVDMIAARNTPIVAIYDAVVWRVNPVDTGLGGITIWLQRSNGDRFYYAHLESVADIRVGQQVSVGQVIGYNGSSGNAPDWLPHLHFEYHPSGRGAVNPYPLVRSLC